MQNQIVVVLLLLFISCEGTKQIQIYNALNRPLNIEVSKPKSGYSSEDLEEFPFSKIEPPSDYTQQERLIYYKNLFRTNNNIVEKKYTLEIEMNPQSSIIIGSNRFLFFPIKMRKEELYIDTLRIKRNNKIVSFNSRNEILLMTKNRNYKVNRINLSKNNKVFKNIIIK